MKVLVVEDDTGLADMLADVLKAHQYQVELADNGEAGMALVEAFDYDLILLDLHLPKLDGIHFCKDLRAAGGDVPVLLMTAENTTASKIAGLDAGADDYVTKPLDTDELLARMRALMRRGRTETSPILSWGTVSLDPSNCEVRCADLPLHLTSKEYAMLELFLRNQHRIFSLGILIERLWTYEKIPSENAVRTHVKELRRKLRLGGTENMIETVYGLGYRLGSEPFETAHPPVNTTPDETADKIAPKAMTSLAKPQDPVAGRLQEIWERHQNKYLDLITQLERTISVAGIEKGEHAASISSDQSVIEKSKRAVHTLKGALGSFGFTASSKIAAQIGPLLAAAPQLSTGQVKQLSDLIQALRQSLQPTGTDIDGADINENKSSRQTKDNHQDIGVEKAPGLSNHSIANHPIQIASPSICQWLIVDNDQPLVEAMMRKASVWGVQVRTAATIEEAQAVLAQHKPDVLVFDPNCATTLAAGLAFLRSLRQQHPTLPVVVISAQDTLSDRLQVLRSSGGCTFLQKPVTANQILETIHQHLPHQATSEARIVALDDDPQILQCLEQQLSPWGFHLTLLSDPVQFWNAMERTTPDLLILDIEMPKLSGLELCQVIRSDPRLCQIPILFLSAHTDSETIRQVFEAGADDYVSKPVQGAELVARILNRLERLQLLRWLAETDSLTGLSCRRQSVVALNHLLKLAARQKKSLCLALLDLDKFKRINDIYGHEVGDHVLKTFGNYLRQAFRGEDIVARWGGEEFVLGLYDSSKAMAVNRLRTLLETFNQHTFAGEIIVEASQQPFQVSFSAGVAAYPDNGKDVQTLYRNADKALYTAKAAGRSRVLPTD